MQKKHLNIMSPQNYFKVMDSIDSFLEKDEIIQLPDINGNQIDLSELLSSDKPITEYSDSVEFIPVILEEDVQLAFLEKIRSTNSYARLAVYMENGAIKRISTFKKSMWFVRTKGERHEALSKINLIQTNLEREIKRCKERQKELLENQSFLSSELKKPLTQPLVSLIGKVNFYGYLDEGMGSIVQGKKNRYDLLKGSNYKSKQCDIKKDTFKYFKCISDAVMDVNSVLCTERSFQAIKEESLKKWAAIKDVLKSSDELKFSIKEYR